MKQELNKEQEIREAYTEEIELMIKMDKLDKTETNISIEKKAIQKKLQEARDRIKSIKFN